MLMQMLSVLISLLMGICFLSFVRLSVGPIILGRRRVKSGRRLVKSGVLFRPLKMGEIRLHVFVIF